MYRKVEFDATAVGPVGVREDECLVRLTFDTCDGLTQIDLMGVDDDVELSHGSAHRGWYRISSPALDDRWTRLESADAVRSLLKHYSVLDASLCQNTRKCTAWCVPADLARARLQKADVPIPRDVRPMQGVPQRLPTSGNCWFSSVCFSLFLNPTMREAVIPRMPAHMQPLARECLVHPDKAEALRKVLWEEMRFGDPYGQPPELDGQNGTSQIFILASRIDLPIKRLMCLSNSDHEMTEGVRDQAGMEHPLRSAPRDADEPHLIVLRFRRGQHSTNERHQPTPILRHRGRTYRLVAIMIGNEHCGHQIAAAAPTDSVRTWAVADSDARRLGIGPMHWTIDTSMATDEDEKLAMWWKSWRTAIPAINYGEGVCDMSPHNRPLEELNGTKPIKLSSRATSMPRDVTVGLTNIDLIYIRV